MFYNSGLPRLFRVTMVGIPDAGVAQLAEHNVANVVVVGSNPITRSFVFSPYMD